MSKRGSRAAGQEVEQLGAESSRAVKSPESLEIAGVQHDAKAHLDTVGKISSEGRKKLVMGRLISRIVSADTCSRTVNGKKKS
jgi:hypothetical protein